MAFSFNYPALLVLAPVAAVFVILTSKNMVRLAKWRKRLVIPLRVMVFVLIVACISGFGIKRASDRNTSIFLLDGSDSTAWARNSVEETMRDALKSKKPSDKVGIVSFGANAAVELAPSDRPQFVSMQAKVNGNFTNIEQALKLASSLIPSGDRKRVVLISDGSENAGDALRQARILRRQDITLDVVPVTNAPGNEVQVKEVSVPRNLRIDEQFEVVVRILSTVKTRATLKLFADREPAAEKSIDIQEGENNFAFTDTAKKGGLVTYTAVIEPDKDTIRKNNTASTFTTVEDTAQILVIQDTDEAASELVKILEKDVKVKVVQPENVPKNIEELQKYDLFIISNVSAERLDDTFLNCLETCVKHQGKGLLVTGGQNSYAPGGYYRTVLEKVLPVNMDIKPKEEMPNLGLVLVIDKSGSMSEGQYGISKVELAKEAAIRSTEVLKKNDMIGVIGFDAAVYWVVKMRKPDNVKAIQDAIGTIRADGGTQILPPLQEAYGALKNADTKLKHIILLTDGQAEKSGYDQLIEDMNRAGITLSTVAVGREADAELLEALSIGGNGRFYKTDVFTDIPKIFAKETFLAGKTYLNNRTFTPSLKSYSDALKGITSVPALDGYVGTTPKTTASVILASDRDDPVLATWQYGLGRTAAWTPDAKGLWTSDWMGWDQSPRFWKNLVSWLTQKKSSEEYAIKGGMEAGTGTLELTLPPDAKNQADSVTATVVSPGGAEQQTVLDPVSPGTYKGTFNSDETGVYIANISMKSGGGNVGTISTGITVPYSPEYDIPDRDPALFLERLASEGGGKVIKNVRDVFSERLLPVTSITDMTPILLPVVIILLMLDIALRRLNIPLNRMERILNAAYGKGMAYAGIVLKPAGRLVASVGKRTHAAGHLPGKSAAPPPQPDTGPQRVAPEDGAPAFPARNKTPGELSRPGAHVTALLEKKKRRGAP